MKTLFIALCALVLLPFVAHAQYQQAISTSPTNGTNEIQRITFGGSATDSTTFNLAWNGRSTGSILWTSDGDADLDTAIKHAINPIFGVNNTTVIIGTLSSGVGYVNVTFIGSYAKKPVGGVMTVSYNGTSGTIAVTQPTPGVLASFRSAIAGGQLLRTDNATWYVNTSTTRLAPTWQTVQTAFNLTGTVPAITQVDSGGTGAATLTAHGVVVGEGTSAVHITAAGTAGQVLTSGGASADPDWTTSVPIANGGTGATTFSGAQTALGWQSAAPLAADTATTGQTLIGAPVALQFAIGTSGTYDIDCYLQVGNSGTNGTEIGILLPSSATMKVYANGNTSGITAWTSDVITASHTVGATFNTSAISTAIIWLHGTVTSGGSAGQVIIQFDAKTSGTATVKAGSYLKAHRIS